MLHYSIPVALSYHIEASSNKTYRIMKEGKDENEENNNDIISMCGINIHIDGGMWQWEFNCGRYNK